MGRKEASLRRPIRAHTFADRHELLAAVARAATSAGGDGAYLTDPSASEFIGVRVARSFGRRGGRTLGTVVGYLPASGDEEALWRVQHDDGDGEDLDEDELKEAIDARATLASLLNDGW